MKTPQVSFVISTRNRRDVLLATLKRVQACGLPADEFDIHVVDNASTDGTAAAVAEQFPNVKLTASERNGGSVAKKACLDCTRARLWRWSVSLTESYNL